MSYSKDDYEVVNGGRGTAAVAVQEAAPAKVPAVKETREFVRFTLLERWLHVCMVVSFISLAVTGMSLKFSYTGWAVKLSHLLGGFAGGQAEYARVPFADVGTVKIPDGLSDEQVLFLSDIFPTGYMAAENCNIQPGDTIAVWGCGPVGQFAMKSAYLLGAERVIGIGVDTTGSTPIPVDALGRALALAEVENPSEIAVIGGGEIYGLFLDHADRIYLTEIDADIEGDTRFPALPAADWRETSCEVHAQGTRDSHPFILKVLDRIRH